MAETAVALLVAGSGATTEDEVLDLLNDAYPPDQYGEVGIVFPVDKALFTETVENVVSWVGEDEEALYPFHTKGAAFTRKSSKYAGGQEVEKVEDIFNPDDFKDWDEVHFLVAMPEDEEDPDFDLYARLVETATDAGIVVKDLTRGLDDVKVVDEAPAEPDPEPEPEKPARRARRAARTEAQVNADETQEALAEVVAEATKDSDPEEGLAGHPEGSLEPQNPWVDQQAELRLEGLSEALGNIVESLLVIRELFAPQAEREKQGYFAAMNTRQPEEVITPGQGKAIAGDALEKMNNDLKDEDKPKRGRGRPRKNFGVAEVYDEDEEAWVPRPEGRLKKGTKWRKVHSENGDVLEHGTA